MLYWQRIKWPCRKVKGPQEPSPGICSLKVAHPKSQAPSILTGGICSLRSHIPARLAAGFAKGYKKAARASSAASLYPFAVRGGFEPPVR